MDKVTVTNGTLYIYPGATLVLDNEQASARAHNLEAGKIPGSYNVLKPIEFKVGEELRLDIGTMDRTQREVLGLKVEPLPTPADEAPAEAQVAEAPVAEAAAPAVEVQVATPARRGK